MNRIPGPPQYNRDGDLGNVAIDLGNVDRPIVIQTTNPEQTKNTIVRALREFAASWSGFANDAPTPCVPSEDGIFRF